MAEAIPPLGERDLREEGSPLSAGVLPRNPGSRAPRRYSSDDLSCNYNSLTQVQVPAHLPPSHSTGAASSLLQQPRRQSVASVQTEPRLLSPRPPSQRRRSDFSHHHHERRRRSRASDSDGGVMLLDAVSLNDHAELNGVGRSARGLHMPGEYDLEDARTSLGSTRLSASSGRARKPSRYSDTHDADASDTPDADDPEERRRSRVVVVCATVAVSIFLIAILLVAVTLKMSPAIDEIVRKENEDILRELQAASAGAPPIFNNTVPPTEPMTETAHT